MPEIEPKPLNLPATPAEKLLLEAWSCYNEYDTKANRLQKRFRRLQMMILLAGIAAVLLVALQKQIEFAIADRDVIVAKAEAATAESTAAAAEAVELHRQADTLHWIVLGVPLLLSALMAATHTFRPGDKWVLLRGSAEAVKRQIFRFRTRTGDFAGAPGSPAPEQVLFERVSAINDQLKQTEVNKCALEQPRRDARLIRRRDPNGKETEVDDGLTGLDAMRYLELRVNDQINFYTNRTRRFDCSITRATIAILLFGAAGTFFAALGWELWIPVATVLAAAFTTYLRYTQSEETLITYNRGRIDLKNIRAWWMKLTPGEQTLPENFSTLVDLTEKVLEEETTGWSQRMSDALAELNRKESDAGKPVK